MQTIVTMRTTLALLLVCVCVQISQYCIHAQCASQGFKTLSSDCLIPLARSDEDTFTEIKIDDLFTGETELGNRANQCETPVAGTLPSSCDTDTCFHICAVDPTCAHAAYAKDDCYIFANGDESIFSADDISDEVKKVKGGSITRGTSCEDLVRANEDCSSTYVSGYQVCNCVSDASSTVETCGLAQSVTSEGVQLFICTSSNDSSIDILIICGGIAGGLLFLAVGAYLGKANRSRKLKGGKLDVLGIKNPIATPPKAPRRDLARSGKLTPAGSDFSKTSAVDFLLQQVQQMEKKKSNAQMTRAQLQDLRKFMRSYDTTIVSDADLDNKVKLMSKFAIHDIVHALMQSYGTVPGSLRNSGVNAM